MASSSRSPPLTGTSAVLLASLAKVPELPWEDVEERRAEAEKLQRNATIFCGSLSLLTMVLALTAMYLYESLVTYLAFCFPLVLGPIVIHQRRQLNKLPTLREEINLSRRQVVKLATLNGIFQRESKRLHDNIQQLKHYDAELDRVANSYGQDGQVLRTLIRESGDLQREMKRLQQAREIQDLMAAILDSDQNRDSTLSDNEMATLMARLRAFTGTAVDQDRLKEALRRSQHKSSSTIARDTAVYIQQEKLRELREDEAFAYVQCAS